MKKSRSYLLSLLIVLVIAACNSPKIYTDYDEAVDFNNYQSFDFYEDMESGLDTLDQVRLQKALQTTLEEKEFSSHTDHPDFKINFYADFTEETNRNDLGISIGTFGSHVGGNIASGIPIFSKRKFMQITVEFADGEKNTLYWQGVAEVRLKNNPSAKERTQIFTTIAQKILNQYPPK